MSHNLFNSRQTFDIGNGSKGTFYSLPALEEAGLGKISRLPVSIRIVLESVLRNCDGKRVAGTERPRTGQLEAEGAAHRGNSVRRRAHRVAGFHRRAAARRSRGDALGRGADGQESEDHRAARAGGSGGGSLGAGGFRRQRRCAARRTSRSNFKRNRERYQFLKWGMQAFDTFKVVPPGIGIVHQVNLEYLAKGVLSKDGVYYPDTLVGTDSHTTMINGLGIVGWGVGGIEAEAGMLGQPVYFLTPEVVGVHLTGALREGVTATDLALHDHADAAQGEGRRKICRVLRPGRGGAAGGRSRDDRQHGAGIRRDDGLFPDRCARRVELSARHRPQRGACRALRELLSQRRVCSGMPRQGRDRLLRIDLELDLASVVPSVAGPKRPQDRIELPKLEERIREAFSKPVTENGFGKAAGDLAKRFRIDCEETQHHARRWQPGTGVAPRRCGDRTRTRTTELEMANNRPTPDPVRPDMPAFCGGDVLHGSVLIAAITSCTNTSNPSVMLAAGLLAKKAVERA